MHRYLGYCKSALLIMTIKLRFGRRANISWIQSFGKRCSIILAKGSHLVIDKGTVTRDSFHLRVEGGTCKIGKSCFFNTNFSGTCVESLQIGDHCSIGQNVVMVDHDHDFKQKTGKLFISSPIIIGNNVWIGANSVILRGTTIGDNCVIAAGSIVKGTIPDRTIYIQEKQTVMKTMGEAHGI